MDRWAVYNGWEKVFDSLTTFAAGFLLCPRCSCYDPEKGCKWKVAPDDEICALKDDYLEAWFNIQEGLNNLTWETDSPGGIEG